MPASDSSLSILFARGVVARLALWPALRLAVDEQWGGPESAQKRTWLASVLVDAFEDQTQTQKPDAFYVEETLLQAMEDEFDAVLEDGSAEAVARDVVRLWGEACTGSDAFVRSLEEQAERVKGKKVQAQVEGNGDGDDEDWSDDGESGSGEDEEMDEDGVPKLVPAELTQPSVRLEPEVDDDGFTMVKPKGKSHR